MKKSFLLLSMLIMHSIHAEEVKVYRWKLSGVNGVLHTSLASLVGLAGTACVGVGAWLSVECKDYTSLALCSISGAIGLGGAAYYFKFLHKWHSLANKPKVIFDDEGFTVEESSMWSDPIDERYLWKDVVKQWDEAVINKYGVIVEKIWCYWIKDKKEIVRIFESDLDISDDIQRARIEFAKHGPQKK